MQKKLKKIFLFFVFFYLFYKNVFYKNYEAVNPVA